MSEQKATFTVQKVAAFNEETPKGDPNLVTLNFATRTLDEFKRVHSNSPILGAFYENPYLDSCQETIPANINELDCRHLQILARNEHFNVNGCMQTHLYNNLLHSDDIAKIRCLVKATVVSGLIYAHHTGGYKGHERLKFKNPQPNILIDQAGLQWQEDFRNTDGLHFYLDSYENDLLPEYYASWQTEMYEAMYGVARRPNASSNNLSVNWAGVTGVLDLDSVSHAIAIEFSQAMTAAVHQSNIHLDEGHKINFKYARAGMGFFASGLRCNKQQLRITRLEGIEMALNHIKNLPPEVRAQKIGKIGRIVLPRSNDRPYSDTVLARIGHLVQELGLEWGGAPEEDSFKPVEGYINAMTNCADPHAMPGNEGGLCSTDAAISYNANINNLNASYNKLMQLQPTLNEALSMSTLLETRGSSPASFFFEPEVKQPQEVEHNTELGPSA